MAITPEKLTTFPPNRMSLTSFFDVEFFELAKNNLQALVLGATGINFSGDLSVSEGHKHETSNDRITWRQLATFPLLNNGSPTFPPFGTPPDEVIDSVLIDSAAPQDLAVLRLLVSAVDSSLLIPRIKVSNGNLATVTCTVTLDFYETDMTTLVDSATIVFTTLLAHDREWIDGSVVDCSAASSDPDIPSRLPLVVLVSGVLSLELEEVALHEVSFGVSP